MVGSINSATSGSVYINSGDNVDSSNPTLGADFKDTQAYQSLVKFASEGYKGADGTNSDKEALQKETQQLVNQLQAGLGSSDSQTGNTITVAMPKASALVALLVAMIESENDSSVASNKMSSQLGVLSQDLTDAAADELRKQGEMALYKGIAGGVVQGAGAVTSGTLGARGSHATAKAHSGTDAQIKSAEAKSSRAQTYGMASKQASDGLSEVSGGAFDMQMKNMEAEQATLTAGSRMLDQSMSMDKDTAQKAAQVMSSLLSLLADVRHTSADMVSTVSGNLKA